jgi:DnaJ-class molecular chaperone
MIENPVEIINEALDILGLPRVVSYKDIKHRYKEISKRVHPDCGGSSEEMAKVNEAYAILKAYIENFKFSFSEEEILKQFPFKEHQNRFRF